jgi:hypothetical protein
MTQAKLAEKADLHPIYYGQIERGEQTVSVQALIRFGVEVTIILKHRPQVKALFPYLQTVRPGDRATEFKQRCEGWVLKGGTLHSYRYTWAERALKCGYQAT